MSDGLNQWTGVGNLGQDPELRVTPSGQAVLRLSLACNESYVDRNNVRQERTEWFRVSVWGKRGEGLAKHLNKGDRICIVGRLRTSKYEKQGVECYSTEVIASEVVFCGSKGGGGGQGGQRSSGGGKRQGGQPRGDAYEDPGAGAGGAGGIPSDDDIPF